ncbi:glutathione S-transferase N-terminal domain-containing protein [Motilimonas sp. 1_MG-2023]|uniref:glutathione S-transferase N-terminal domain-containing protein n=1 Tax=Motilimonas sp. 1_MG-2023 TaxID=3062672 RepID=UPI0026E3C461|nr:glutathione S-transferase N-terminal domain-containing protein [Motilimonas sp. 1_MG-2023]MDO6524506.1 glutathione S-transferase N-terminal domain-containing protein [Motilimonas sp. 1_MG-2023]
MYTLFYAPTPNGHKITLMLEALEVPYRIVPINIQLNDQFLPSFLEVAPNNRMPALIDHENGQSVFESGAILTYLAEKHLAFLPEAGPERYEVLQWLNWQIGGLGPMAGQNHHFNYYAPDRVPYGIKRYTDETTRLYGVLDRQLSEQDYVAGDYSIADMAIYPWVRLHDKQKQDITLFPNIMRYLATMDARADVQAALQKEAEFDWQGSLTEQQLQQLLEV